MIQPTVGRIVWCKVRADQKEPYAGIIVAVQDDHTISVSVFFPDGSIHFLSNVRLYQEGDQEPGDDEVYCVWMPYQKGQAAKYEAGGGSFEELKKKVEELQATVASLAKAASH